VQGTHLVHNLKNSVDERLAFAVRQIAQRYASTPKVRIFIGVASWTAQRAFARDFD
jgi:hypothetical protein